MNCENALELMNRELDEALTAEESAALRAHLDACPDCRETWRQLHELDALLQESELEPPAALHDGVMREIRQEQKRKPRRAWLPAAAIAAAAALVLLAGKAGLGGRADLCADRCGSTGRSRRTAGGGAFRRDRAGRAAGVEQRRSG